MPKIILLMFSILLSHQVFAHDDHGPSEAQAPKGGVMRSLETVHLEFLTKGKTISIYPYAPDLKPEQAKKYPVSATVSLPKRAPQSLVLVDKGDHWESEFDAKGAHRYKIELKIFQGGHNDVVKYTVEPKK